MPEIDPSTLHDIGAADRFDVFLSSTGTDPVRTAEIERLLEEGGLRVFRDTGRLDGVTPELAAALAGSRVLLTDVADTQPARYVWQWESTAAFLAARREGDSRRRLLTIGPDDDLAALAGEVQERAAEAVRPFGAARSMIDPAVLPARVRRSHGFVGRYQQLWAIHDALHAMDSPSAVVLRGRSGIGKSSLAAKYAYLYRDEYRGGMFWTGPFGQHDPEDLLSRFHLGLARTATDGLGLDVRGIPFGRLRRLVAECLSGAAGQVLWIIDDLPSDLPPSVLDQLLIPSPRVSTVLTSRADRSAWQVEAIDLPGLTPEEGLGLFSQTRMPSDDEERAAVLLFAQRSSGQPLVIRGAAEVIRGRLTAENLSSRPRDAPQAIRDELTRLDPLVLDVLGVAAVLAPVPIPGGLVAEVLGLDAEPPLPAFADFVDGGWQLNELAIEVLRETTPALAEFALRAAPVLLDWIERGRGGCADHLTQHAEAVAEWPVPQRIRLLRPAAARYEAQGDLAAAGEIRARILSIDPGSAEDLVSVARVELGCGLHAEAVGHARKAAELAGADERLRRLTKLLAAQALDEQGRYAEADREFWNDNAGEAGERPFCLVLATAVACRLRGRPADAVALLEPVLADPPDEFAVPAKLEYARSLQLAGWAADARAIAGEVFGAYRAAGRGWHPNCTEAEVIHAEATLTLDLAELNTDARPWEWSAAELRRVRDSYEQAHGPGSPLTLAAAVRADRALLALGQPERALVALAATEREVIRVVGEDHPLRYRIRHAMALAHGRLRDFGRQADILCSILEQQIRLLGLSHPETIESHLDLGIALAMCGREPRERAVALVDAAARSLTSALGPAVELSAKAMNAKWVVQLPYPLLSAMVTIERLP